MKDERRKTLPPLWGGSGWGEKGERQKKRHFER